MSEDTPKDQMPPIPVGCIIASGQIIPEIMGLRTGIGETNREMSRHDDRLNRLHLQCDDNSRRLNRLETMVETQTKEFQSLTRRFDSVDIKVNSIDNKVQFLLDGFGSLKTGIEMLSLSLSDHGIKAVELHGKRMKGIMSLWVVFGAIVVILSAMHYQATGVTPLSSMINWVMGLMP